MTKKQMIEQAENGHLNFGELNAFLRKLGKLNPERQRWILKMVQDEVAKTDHVDTDLTWLPEQGAGLDRRAK